MLSIVWHVMGTAFDVDEFVTDFALHPDRVWRKGEPSSRRKSPHAESGFSLSIDRAEDEDLDRALNDIRSFLKEFSSALEAVISRGAQSTLDIGITVGDKMHFTRSIRIPPDILGRVADVSAVLELSAYSSCGEEQPGPPLRLTGSSSD